MDKILEYLRINVRMNLQEQYFVISRIITGVSKIISSLEHSFYTQNFEIDPVTLYSHTKEVISNVLLIASTDATISSKSIVPLPDYQTRSDISTSVMLQTLSKILNDTAILLNDKANQHEDIAYHAELLIHILEDLHNVCDMIGVDTPSMYEELFKQMDYYFMASTLDHEKLKPKNTDIEESYIGYILDIELHPNHSYKKLTLTHKKIPLKEFNSGNLVVDFFHASSFLKATSREYFYSANFRAFLLETKGITSGYILNGMLITSQDVPKTLTTEEFRKQIFHVILLDDMRTFDDVLDYINKHDK